MIPISYCVQRYCLCAGLWGPTAVDIMPQNPSISIGIWRNGSRSELKLTLGPKLNAGPVPNTVYCKSLPGLQKSKLSAFPANSFSLALRPGLLLLRFSLAADPPKGAVCSWSGKVEMGAQIARYLSTGWLVVVPPRGDRSFKEHF